MNRSTNLATVTATVGGSPTDVDPALPSSIDEGEKALPTSLAFKQSQTAAEVRQASRLSYGTVQSNPIGKSFKRNAFRPVAEWQGYITKLDDQYLYATMDGVFGEAIVGKRHDAMIPRSEVSPEDSELVREGAYFRLSILYSVSRGGEGTSNRLSTLVFRRLPAFRRVDLDAARELAQGLLGGIRLE